MAPRSRPSHPATGGDGAAERTMAVGAGSFAGRMRAASSGQALLDCAPNGKRHVIPAEAIRSACVGGGLDRFGLRLRGAVVDGVLDLRGVDLDATLAFHGCTFTDAPLLDGASLQALVVAGDVPGPAGPALASELPGLAANGLRLTRDLVLSSTHVTGELRTQASVRRSAAVWLCESQIDGRLLAVGTRITTTADRALQADNARIRGDVRLAHGFEADAEVRMIGAEVGGSLDLTAASLRPARGHALDLAEASLSNLFLVGDGAAGRWADVRGRIDLGQAQVRGRILVRHARWSAGPVPVGWARYPSPAGEEGVALTAPGLTVGGNVLIDPDVVVEGALLLPGARLGGGLRADGASLLAPGRVVLDLSEADVRAGLSMRGTIVEGTVDLGDTSLLGSADLHGLSMSSPREWHQVDAPQPRCLRAVGLRVSGDVTLLEARVEGGSLDFRAATIDGIVDLGKAELHHQGGYSVILHQARVGGNVRLCEGFSSEGVVMLNRVRIGGRLRCDTGRFTWQRDGAAPPEWNPRDAAFEMISGEVARGIGLGWDVTGAVDLTDARTTFLADDADADWTSGSSVTGFVYERFAPVDVRTARGVWDAGRRAAWLRRIAPDDPRPWEQASLVLRADGDVRGAEDLLIAWRRSQRAARRRWWSRWWDAVSDAVIRYGYRPQRALALLGGLTAAVALALALPAVNQHLRAADPSGVVFQPAGEVPGQRDGNPIGGVCGGGRVRCFEPVLYAIDTVVPIIDLKQRDAWRAWHDAGGQVLDLVLNLCTLLGWLLSTVFALSFAKLGRLGE